MRAYRVRGSAGMRADARTRELVYRRTYGRLKPLYEEIREITGYPPR